MAHDVFLSYSSADRATADAVVAGLEAQGIRCWIAPRDIPAGTEYGEEIIEAVKGCRVCVVIFSASANCLAAGASRGRARRIGGQAPGAVSHRRPGSGWHGPWP